MGKRRGRNRRRLQIIADVLHATVEGAKKTQVMYRANLSYELLGRYLKEVIEADLVCFEGSLDCYTITRKGREFLDRFGEYYKRYSKIQEQLSEVNMEKMALKRMVDIKSANE